MKFPFLDIQVDGGISRDNIQLVAKAGANVIVAGTSIFNASVKNLNLYKKNPLEEKSYIRKF